jgi:hypothetical protein
LKKYVKLEYAALDSEVQKTDTSLNFHHKKFDISFNTSCLNDSLIAQEIYGYAGPNAKSYLISHNYKTDISIKVNGKSTGAKSIHKEMFKDKLDKDFLEKSIIKHPSFVRFDTTSNEAIFEFMVGVPNTDWLVLAGININEQGKIRIIEINMPEL